MKLENAIEVNNITKKFKVYLDKGRTLKELALFSKRRKYEEREVLKGISFEVKKGEAIGLIGKNGCGKSTTLKLLTKIMYPNSGTIEMKGRVSSLIELGAGFHPDMSGRQNIYINASIFGLTKKEIDARVNAIIAFSELEEFIDNPVRTYSSGMYMRLAFAVAINVDADILLIDEILAVGDANFQNKCFNKMREIKARGTTIVIVSHSLTQIELICDRTIWIDNGKILEDGKPRDVHLVYMDFMGKKHKENVITENRKVEERAIVKENKKDEVTDTLQTEMHEIMKDNRPRRFGNGKVRMISIDTIDGKGKKSTVFTTGEKVEIIIKYKAKQAVDGVVVGICFIRSDGVYSYGTNTLIDRVNSYNLSGEGEIIISFDRLTLLPGVYKLDIALEEDMSIPLDYYREAYQIEMYSSIADLGVARMDHTWR